MIQKTFKADGRLVSFPDGDATAGSWDTGDSPRRFGKVHDMIDGVFEGLALRFLKLSATSKVTDKDGVEAIAMLSVLREFSAVYLEWSEDSKDDSVKAAVSPSNGSSNSAITSLFANNNDLGDLGLGDGPLLKAADDSSKAGSGLPPRATYFVSKMLHELTTAFEAIVSQFRVEQIVWINSQKADPKSPMVLPPFYKFPTLLQQVLEMTNGMVSTPPPTYFPISVLLALASCLIGRHCLVWRICWRSSPVNSFYG